MNHSINRPARSGSGPVVALLLFDGLTAIDAVGPYEVLSRVPGASVVTVGKRTGLVRTDSGMLELGVGHTLEQVSHADVLVVPGGDVRELRADDQVLEWVRRIHRRSTWTASVCTGSLVLGAAGLLRGLPATTYWAMRAELAGFGARYVQDRFVEADRIITSAGMSAGIDMALHLAAKLTDDRVGQALQLLVEYDPAPPFDTGSPEKAGADLQRLALDLLGLPDAARTGTR
ncbi:DJ-1/PfpI family protein [Asanoa sp. WMMD1127]|uniref:DJ-1/PfpI family protein n=1 Tax=Asanoa sp. WMMD1127 TaxID=3016107 RepID=UPI002416FAC7|nr:DJ-1/PfpI family protein [Asanoa sp. WMMD1127]MDG4825083.1 DJ-1/PfpI family protein [Asanoa sp. WMMD1127]